MKKTGYLECVWSKEELTEEQYRGAFWEFLMDNDPAQKNIIKILLKKDPTKHYGLYVKYEKFLLQVKHKRKKFIAI
jgi:hypothetical protein